MTTEKGKKLTTFLATTKGIIDPASAQAEIAKMAAQCPAATAAEKNLTTDVEKAYEVMMISTGQAAVADPTAVTAVSTAPTPEMSAEEARNIGKTLAAQQTERAAVTANTTIESYVFDRPAPADVIPNGTTGLIRAKSWEDIKKKIESGEWTVLPDDGEEVEPSKRIASTTNFNKLDAAFQANTAVEVYVGNLTTKPIGYIVKKGSTVGTSNQAVQMTREDLQNFLILDAAGYINASKNTPGARLRYIPPKESKTEVGKRIPGRTVLADANKKAAVDAGAYEISREVTSESKAQSLKSALSFRVQKNNQTLADGVTKKVATVRASVTAEIPTLRRKPTFVEVFGTGEHESNGDLINPPTKEQAKKIAEAQLKAVQELRAKAASETDYTVVADLEEKLKAFNAPASGAPAASF